MTTLFDAWADARTRMKTLSGCVCVLTVVAACATDSAPPRNDSAEATAAAAWVVRPDSFGPIALGAPLAHAQGVLGDSLLKEANDATLNVMCEEMWWPLMPTGSTLMVLRDSVDVPAQIERVDIVAAGVRTAEGAGVGDSEARVLELYRGRIRVEPHKYTGPRGHYLVVSDSRDTLHRIIFETDGQRVTRYRAGRRPAVEQVEGCR